MKYYKTFLTTINELYEVNSCPDDFPLKLRDEIELFGKKFPVERFWIGPDEYISLMAEITKKNNEVTQNGDMAEKIMRQMSKTNIDLKDPESYAYYQNKNSGLIL